MRSQTKSESVVPFAQLATRSVHMNMTDLMNDFGLEMSSYHIDTDMLTISEITTRNKANIF